MRSFLLVLAAIGLHAQAFDNAGGGNWLYQVPVTVPSGSVSGDVTEYTAYLDLADLPADFHTNVKADGCDIRIAASDGVTELPIDLVSYDSASDTGELYTRTDLSSSSDTTLYVVYGNPSATCYADTATYGEKAVWENHTLVLHGDEFVDRSPSNQEVTNYGCSLVTGGIAGGAFGCNQGATKTQRVEVTDYLYHGPLGAPAIWTTLVWAYPEDVEGSTVEYQDLQYPISHGGFDGSTIRGFHFYLYEQNQGFYPLMRAYYFDLYGGEYDTFEAPVGALNNTWYNLAFSINGNVPTATFFVDGTAYATAPEGADGFNPAGNIYIGTRKDLSTSRYFDGKLDEVRFLNYAVSAAYVKAAHDNYVSETFYTVGAQEDYSPSELNPPVADFTIDVTTGDAPLLVQFTDTSTNTPTSWSWDVDNDATPDYTTQNPSHTYSSPGTYTVSMKATNADGSDTVVKTDLITVSSPPPPPQRTSMLGTTTTVVPGISKPDDFYSAFKTYDEYVVRLQYLATLYPHLMTLENIGNSHLGNPIYAARLSATDTPDAEFLFISTVHAREWPAMYATMYSIEAFLTNYHWRADITALLDQAEIIIIPVANPDGVLYTENVARQWRKTRSGPHGSGCYGVDINRNWNVAWAAGTGASTNPCSDTYKGPSAESEVEMKHILALADSLTNFSGFMDIHGCAEAVSWPYTYTSTAISDTEYRVDISSTAVEIKNRLDDIFPEALYQAMQTSPGVATHSGAANDRFYQRYKVPSLLFEVHCYAFDGQAAEDFSIPLDELGLLNESTFEALALFADKYTGDPVFMDNLVEPSLVSDVNWAHWWASPYDVDWVDQVNGVTMAGENRVSPEANGVRIANSSSVLNLDDSDPLLSVNMRLGEGAFSVAVLFTQESNFFSGNQSSRIFASASAGDGFDFQYSETLDEGGYVQNLGGTWTTIEPAPITFPAFRCMVSAGNSPNGTMYVFDMDAGVLTGSIVTDQHGTNSNNNLVGVGNWSNAFIARGLPGVIHGVGLSADMFTEAEALEACQDLATKAGL